MDILMRLAALCGWRREGRHTEGCRPLSQGSSGNHSQGQAVPIRVEAVRVVDWPAAGQVRRLRLQAGAEVATVVSVVPAPVRYPLTVEGHRLGFVTR
jgi:hypothetical protein